jgi:hypothetical protein
MAKVYRIDKLERGERGGRTGLFVEMFNVTDDKAGNKPVYCDDYFQKDEITALEDAGEGALVEIGWKKNGKFYNIDSVKPTGEKETPKPKTSSTSKSSGDSESSKPSTKKSGGSSQYRKPEELIRSDAFRQAKDIAVGMLLNSDAGKFFPKTKTTADIFTDYIFTLANEIAAYVKGERKGTVDSSDADLDKKGVDAGEPELPGDEPKSEPKTQTEEREPGSDDEDDDDIPF